MAIADGRIVAIGRSLPSGAMNGLAETIDARGKLVTPGFIDVHTHYDGQVTWSDQLAPSSWNGVTTVLTGNCGVGRSIDGRPTPTLNAAEAELAEIAGALGEAGAGWLQVVSDFEEPEAEFAMPMRLANVPAGR